MRTTKLIVILAVATVLAGTLGGVATADPDADCIGTERGAAVQADSGFTVWYNDSEPMPRNGVFENDDTLRFRNVTLSSAGGSELVLESGTGPVTCLGGVAATATPVTVDPDGEQSFVVGGQVDALSVADARFGDGSPDLAYDAGGEWTIELANAGVVAGTELIAADGSDVALDTASVDADGNVTLSLPAGTNDVFLRETGSEGGNQSNGGTADDATDGDVDDDTGTGDGDGGTNEDGTVDGDGADASSGDSSAGSSGDADDGDSESDGGGIPWLPIAGLLAVLALGGIGVYQYGENPGGNGGPAEPRTADESDSIGVAFENPADGADGSAPAAAANAEQSASAGGVDVDDEESASAGGDTAE